MVMSSPMDRSPMAPARKLWPERYASEPKAVKESHMKISARHAGSRITVYSPGGSSIWSRSRAQREMAFSARAKKSIPSTSGENASARAIPSLDMTTRPISAPVTG